MALTKMWTVLMRAFVYLAPLSFFPNVPISFTYEVVFGLPLCVCVCVFVSLFSLSCFSSIFKVVISHKGELTAGGVSQQSCPYKCMSDKYRMPNCYTPLEELIYTFGGPLPFSLILSCILVLLAVLLSTLRIKLVKSSSYGENSIQQHSHHHFPYLLSLSEVQH